MTSVTHIFLLDSSIVVHLWKILAMSQGLAQSGYSEILLNELFIRLFIGPLTSSHLDTVMGAASVFQSSVVYTYKVGAMQLYLILCLNWVDIFMYGIFFNSNLKIFSTLWMVLM